MTLKKVNTLDKNLQLIQDNVDYALTPIQISPLNGGNLLSSVTLSSGNNTISHQLGYTPSSWIVTDLNAASNIYRTSWNSQFIVLNSSAGCVISLWVK